MARKARIFRALSGCCDNGVKKLVENGEIERDERIVCVITGHGLEDLGRASKTCGAPIVVELSLQGIQAILDKPFDEIQYVP